MANEINIQAFLTFQRFNPPLIGSGNKDITQTGKFGITNIQNIIASGTTPTLNLGSMGTLGYIFVKNLDSTNFVQLSLNDFTQIFAKLRPGEFCLFPANQNTIYAKANTNPCDVLVCAVEL
jgi:hypothetical protein